MVPVSFKVHADFLCLSRHLYIIIQFFCCGWCMYIVQEEIPFPERTKSEAGQQRTRGNWPGLGFCSCRITLLCIIVPDYIIIPRDQFQRNTHGQMRREAVNGDTNIFLSKRTLKYHWRLVHFKCLHCCTALLRPLLRPCLISSPHF